MSPVRCTLVWDASRDSVRAAFSRAASTYLAATPLQEAVARRLVDGITGAHVGPVLDVASGPGRLRKLWPVPAPKPFVELDLAPTMLETDRPDGRPWPVCGDAERLPFRAGSFRTVVSSSALQWLGDAMRFAAELATALADGGRFHLAFFTTGTFSELASAVGDVLDTRWTMRFPDPSAVADRARELGLVVDEPRTETIVTREADLLGFLKGLRRVGSGYHGREPNPFAGRPTLVSRLARSYAERFPHSAGGIRVSYCVAYVRGAK